MAMNKFITGEEFSKIPNKVSESTVKILTEKSEDINEYVGDLIQKKLVEKIKIPMSQ